MQYWAFYWLLGCRLDGGALRKYGFLIDVNGCILSVLRFTSSPCWHAMIPTPVCCGKTAVIFFFAGLQVHPDFSRAHHVSLMSFPPPSAKEWLSLLNHSNKLTVKLKKGNKNNNVILIIKISGTFVAHFGSWNIYVRNKARTHLHLQENSANDPFL